MTNSNPIIRTITVSRIVYFITIIIDISCPSCLLILGIVIHIAYTYAIQTLKSYRAHSHKSISIYIKRLVLNVFSFDLAEIAHFPCRTNPYIPRVTVNQTFRNVAKRKTG